MSFRMRKQTKTTPSGGVNQNQNNKCISMFEYTTGFDLNEIPIISTNNPLPMHQHLIQAKASVVTVTQTPEYEDPEVIVTQTLEYENPEVTVTQTFEYEDPDVTVTQTPEYEDDILQLNESFQVGNETVIYDKESGLWKIQS